MNPPLHLGELAEAELFHRRLERQIFAERHQMQLVVDLTGSLPS
jgi:hypothetical protein